jgi:P3 major capsid protein
MPTATKPAPAAQLTPEQINGIQRRMILKQAVKMKQQIFSTTIANPGANNNVINVVPRNVGLVIRFLVEVICNYAVTTGASAAVSDFGALNSLSNVQFTDLQNNQRHNTTGLHLGMVAAFKEQQPWLGAMSLAQEAGNYGGNWGIASAVAPTTSVVGSSRVVYEVPIAIHDDDLRGAIYAGVVANQMNLQLTVNPTPTVLPANDDTFAVFSGAGVTGGGAITSVTVNVYQEYYDQLPIGQSGVVLPVLDVSTVYQLLYTNFTAIAAGQDFYIPYTNYRKYLSQLAIYNNSGGQGGRVTGADITYWAQVAANFTNIFNVGPLEQARIARRILGTDPPPGLYYFPSRSKPIDTLNYGNMQLDIKPITAGAKAYCYVMSEFIAYQNALANAGSLPANG